MAKSRHQLFMENLNTICLQCLQTATMNCKKRGNPYVELVHWIYAFLKQSNSDFHRILEYYEIDLSQTDKDMLTALDRLPTGASSISDFSQHVDECFDKARIHAKDMGETKVRTGHVILALSKDYNLRNVFLGMSPQFNKIVASSLESNFGNIVKNSPEQPAISDEGAPGEGGEVRGESALARFATDLTEKARNKEMDPIRGRDDEIRQIVDILMRRRQNNPILTGEAGVGKTAVVEGFAQRIAAGDVPPVVKNVSLQSLDLGLLEAGASMKGEFENRLRMVIEEVQKSEKPIILFIDEAHRLIGAGGSAGTGDAANLLKPALARGTLRTIAATTWAEYKKHIEKDPALTRRFQVVKVEEPSEEKCVQMIRGLAEVQEKHHKVLILDEALEAAVSLSHRYIPDRQLPDKAVSLLDTACARVAISQHSTPPELEDCIRCIEALEIEIGIVEREIGLGMEHTERKQELAECKQKEEARRAELEAAYSKEKNVVEQIKDIRAKLAPQGPEALEKAALASQGKATDAADTAEESEESAAEPAAEADPDALRQKLRDLQNTLKEMQGEMPLIMPCVDYQAVASVVGDWTGIPVGRMVSNEIDTVLKLADIMGKRVIGQHHALETIASRIRTSRANLDNPKRPIGVFMLVGPSGVGKTESALALAEALYGGEQNVITINMSEFQEAHTVSTLKGAPPGYVGYGEGGVLTEAVRRRPYSIVLLDEVEKAHHDVHEIFFQVFDKGQMEDGEGRLIDFKNTIILLTSNVGTDLIENMCKDPELLPDPDSVTAALKQSLLKEFPAALLGRLIVVPFYPISDEVMKKIIVLQMSRIKKRIRENHNIPFTHDDAVLELISNRCTDPASGARMVDAILTNTLLPAISNAFLRTMMSGGVIKKVHVGVKDSEFDYTFE